MVDREVIEVGGAAGTLRVLCWSESGARDTGRPIALLLHGFPDAPDTWEPTARRLAADGWRVAAPYLRGYAPSDLASDGSYHVGALMDDALRVVDALGTTDRDVVIGHDWGAIIAGVLASLPDNPFRKAVLMSVPPIPVFYPIRGLGVRRSLPALLPKQLLRSWYIMFFQLPKLPERSARKVIPFLWRRWSVRRDVDLTPVYDAIGAPDRWTAAISYYRCAARDKTVPARYRAYQDRFGQPPQIPVLYLHGDRDGALGAGFADRARVVLAEGSSVHVVADAGHFLQFDKPEETIGKITGFVGDAR
ncbi:MAG: alpha/beta fold hydrolase [Gordonia amarae]